MPVGGCRGHRSRRGLLGCFLLAAAAALHASPVQGQHELPTVRLQLLWFHQAQFAGYYVAHALGLYEREGIGVDFIRGGPPIPGAPATDSLRMLSHGAADVAVGSLSGALAFRRDGGDVVNIAQTFKRPATLLVCRRAAGIRRAADLRGRAIGVWSVGDQPVPVHA
jgi:NitT/TauT family transport system substrate-binding protein